jgi:hypothetical protein
MFLSFQRMRTRAIANKRSNRYTTDQLAEIPPVSE